MNIFMSSKVSNILCYFISIYFFDMGQLLADICYRSNHCAFCSVASASPLLDDSEPSGDRETPISFLIAGFVHPLSSWAVMPTFLYRYHYWKSPFRRYNIQNLNSLKSRKKISRISPFHPAEVHLGQAAKTTTWCVFRAFCAGEGIKMKKCPLIRLIQCCAGGSPPLRTSSLQIVYAREWIFVVLVIFVAINTRSEVEWGERNDSWGKEWHKMVNFSGHLSRVLV